MRARHACSEAIQRLTKCKIYFTHLHSWSTDPALAAELCRGRRVCSAAVHAKFGWTARKGSRRALAGAELAKGAALSARAHGCRRTPRNGLACRHQPPRPSARRSGWTLQCRRCDRPSPRARRRFGGRRPAEDAAARSRDLAWCNFHRQTGRRERRACRFGGFIRSAAFGMATHRMIREAAPTIRAPQQRVVLPRTVHFVVELVWVARPRGKERHRLPRPVQRAV